MNNLILEKLEINNKKESLKLERRILFHDSNWYFKLLIFFIILIPFYIFFQSEVSKKEIKFNSQVTGYSTRRFFIDFQDLNIFHNFMSLNLKFNYNENLKNQYISIFTYITTIFQKNHEKKLQLPKKIINISYFNNISDTILLYSTNLITFSSFSSTISIQFPDTVYPSGSFFIETSNVSNIISFLIIRFLIFLISFYIFFVLIFSEITYFNSNFLNQLLYISIINIIFGSNLLIFLNLFSNLIILLNLIKFIHCFYYSFILFLNIYFLITNDNYFINFKFKFIYLILILHFLIHLYQEIYNLFNLNIYLIRLIFILIILCNYLIEILIKKDLINDDWNFHLIILLILLISLIHLSFEKFKNNNYQYQNYFYFSEFYILTLTSFYLLYSNWLIEFDQDIESNTENSIGEPDFEDK